MYCSYLRSSGVISRRTRKSQRTKDKSFTDWVILSFLTDGIYIFFACFAVVHSHSRASNYKQWCLYAAKCKTLVLLPLLLICSSSFVRSRSVILCFAKLVFAILHDNQCCIDDMLDGVRNSDAGPLKSNKMYTQRGEITMQQ